MASSTRIRFADSGGVDIAYQVLGEGPIDLLQWCGLGIPVASMDDDPSLARFERRLASMGRLIRLDPRDTGMSDRGTPSGLQYADELAADAVAVLDAVGSDRAVIIAPYVASPGGITLAATRSDRWPRAWPPIRPSVTGGTGRATLPLPGRSPGPGWRSSSTSTSATTCPPSGCRPWSSSAPMS